MSDLDTFFAATAGAAGALVGLLFVAISVSREQSIGQAASAKNRARSSLALTSLVTPLVVSLFALIPAIGIRIPALVAGIGGLLFTAASIRRVMSTRDREHGWRHTTFLIGFGVISLVEAGVGIALLVDADWADGPTIFAAMQIALIGIGVDRAWELVGGRTTNMFHSVTDIIQGEQQPKDESAD